MPQKQGAEQLPFSFISFAIIWSASARLSVGCGVGMEDVVKVGLRTTVKLGSTTLVSFKLATCVTTGLHPAKAKTGIKKRENKDSGFMIEILSIVPQLLRE
ncbi:MAG: hypothetical protein CVU44_09450 [Chloroflexi bacterium HGW-Chloroflexi-6]|nr:MAG: hypothetical protein CVU44_09450 [Chloroflexi bacterium HGW-Chloroflexi-6]